MTTILTAINGNDYSMISDRGVLSSNSGVELLIKNIETKIFQIEDILIGLSGYCFAANFFILHQNFHNVLREDNSQPGLEYTKLSLEYIRLERMLKEAHGVSLDSEDVAYDTPCSLIINNGKNIYTITSENSIFKDKFVVNGVKFSSLGSGSILAAYHLKGQLEAGGKRNIPLYLRRSMMAASDNSATGNIFDLISLRRNENA